MSEMEKENGVSDIERKKPRITEFGPCHDTVQEIESLRQRVKELESSLKSAQDGCNAHLNNHLKCLDELAALKADDSLTVAYMSGFYDGKKAAAPKPEVPNER